ncbi:MAG: hypothetical protein AAB649_07875, partial [Patescibacteria group bacterium]
MHTTNKIGIRMVVITLILALGIFGAWKAFAFLISQHPDKSLPSPTPKAEQALLLPSPNTTLPPELQKQITSYTTEAEKSIGTYTKKYVESLPADIEKKEVLNPTKVENFVDTNKEALLPELFKGTVQT